MNVCLLFIAALLCICRPTAAAAEPKPVALVGHSYGIHEVASIVRTIFDDSDWVFEEKGGFLDVGEFEKYALVIIAHSQERPYTPEEHAQIARYLEGGGELLLIQQAPLAMAKDAPSREALYQWYGMKQRAIRGTPPDEITLADHPLLANVAPDAAQPPTWVSGDQGVAELADDVKPLIHGPGGTFAAFRNVGSGRVVYLGSEHFRLAQPGSPHEPSAKSYAVLIRNIIAEARPLTFAHWHRRQAREWQAR